MNTKSLSRSTILVFFTITTLFLMLSACRREQGPAVHKNSGPAPAALVATIDPGEAAIGDRVTYTLLLSRVPEITAALPEPGASPEGMVPIDTGHSAPRTEGGRIVEKRWVTYRVDRIGALTIPAARMRYQHNGVETEIESQSITLQVKSVLPQDMTDIHDLKPLELSTLYLWYFVAAGAILLLTGFAARRLWKTRRTPEPIKPPLLPHQEVEQRLRELEAMGLLAKGDFKQYYFLLSEIFRTYLEKRFAFPAVERTPEEILERLAALQVTDAQRDGIRSFLRNTEPVKFANAISDPEEAIAETDRVRHFVAETVPLISAAVEEHSHVAV